MTFDYARAQRTADRLLARFGQTGSITRTTPGGGPAHDPGEPTTTIYAATFAVLDFDNRDVDGTLIKSMDRQVLVSAVGLAITPTTTDRVVIGSASHTIVRVRPLAPAGTNVYFEIQCRL